LIIGSARDQIVDKGYSVTDEDFVFDRYAFADKRVRRDLAAPAYPRVFLNFDERANLRAVADLAAVEIDEVMNDHVAPKLDVGRDQTELAGHETIAGQPDAVR
jgi:hypothetical protein